MLFQVYKLNKALNKAEDKEERLLDEIHDLEDDLFAIKVRLT